MAMDEHEAYVAAAPEPLRPLLAAIRCGLVQALPEAEPVMMYGMPGFRVAGVLVAGYAAFARRCGLYLDPRAITDHAAEIASLGLKATKTGVTFSPKGPVPADLIRRLAASSRQALGV